MRQFREIDVPQLSPEWFAARLGRLTGSCASDMLASIKTGEAAARRDLRMKLVCERLTGKPQDDGYVTTAMQRGLDLQPTAVAAYEAQTGQVVARSGFLAHGAYQAGCSLDGHVDDYAGIIELKCPKSATHLRYLRADGAPPEHLPQIYHNLWVTGAAWCDFVSFDDRFPPPLQLVIVRVQAERAWLADYERKAIAFLAEVDAVVDQLMEKAS